MQPAGSRKAINSGVWGRAPGWRRTYARTGRARNSPCLTLAFISPCKSRGRFSVSHYTHSHIPSLSIIISSHYLGTPYGFSQTCPPRRDAARVLIRCWRSPRRPSGAQIDWSAWLAREQPAEQVKAIRGRTMTGRPCGDLSFIERLESMLGRALKLKKGTDEWQRFFDLAAVSRREIPEDIMSDEELVKRLPLVFRTLRGQKVGDAQLDALVAKIRKA